uniref:ribosomal protein L14 n=1 Tax=Meteora sporadica TaxID=2913902 RepID=UPI0030012AAF|nr:ribosomal protein L14 [Meteora sporadica]
MVSIGTYVNIADNSGALIGQCIYVTKHKKKNGASIGDTILVTIKNCKARSKSVKKGSIIKGVVVRTKKSFSRKNGTYLKFDQNDIVLLDSKSMPLGTRVFGVVPQELRNRGYSSIVALSSGVI